jgi:tetratricopeptide (TPR) repeat protein
MPDNAIQRFWQELYRRKVIRVAVVYAVVAWAMIEAASVVFPSLLLPDWSLRMLVIMALLGFPVAVGLAWAFEIKPENPAAPASPQWNPDTPTPTDETRLEGWKRIALHLNRDVRTVRRWEKSLSLPVRRLMHDRQATVYAYKSELDSWVAQRDAGPVAVQATATVKPRLGSWLAIPALGLVAVFAWYMFSGNQSTAIALGEWDWVMITDFDNRTAEDVLEGTVEVILQRELANSRHVRVVPRARIEAALQLMKQPMDTEIDLALGREISLRDGGIKLLVIGRIDQLGGAFLIGTELVNPSDGVTLASFSRDAASLEDILPRVSELARDVRRALGEGIASIEASQEVLLKATTPSLEALRLYSRADRLMRTQDRPKAIPLLEEAVRIDPNFASAHLLLVYLMRDRNDLDRAQAHLERAVELSDQTTERERLFILARYYRHLGEGDREIETYEMLTSLYPDHNWATGNLANLLAWRGRYEEAYPYFLRRGDQNPNSLFSQFNAAHWARVYGDEALAQAYRAKMNQLEPMEWMNSMIDFMPFAAAWVEGDLDQAQRIVDEMVANRTPEELVADGLRYLNARVAYQALGQLERGRTVASWRPGVGWMEAVSDWDLGRPERLETWFEQNPASYWHATLLARSGRPEAARAMLKTPGINDSDERRILRDWQNMAFGQIAFEEGRYQEALDYLAEDFYLHISARYAQQLLINTRARAHLALGQVDQAVADLESSRKQKMGVIQARGSVWFWQRNLYDLAELYDAIGETRKAENVRAELAATLILADSDHPFL